MKIKNFIFSCVFALSFLLIALGFTACSIFEESVPSDLVTPTPAISANVGMPLIDNTTYTILFAAVIGLIIIYLFFREEKKK